MQMVKPFRAGFRCSPAVAGAAGGRVVGGGGMGEGRGGGGGDERG